MITTFRLGFDVLVIVFTRVTQLAIQQQEVYNLLCVMTTHIHIQAAMPLSTF